MSWDLSDQGQCGVTIDGTVPGCTRTVPMSWDLSDLGQCAVTIDGTVPGQSLCPGTCQTWDSVGLPLMGPSQDVPGLHMFWDLDLGEW